jgi:hypothetical protein
MPLDLRAKIFKENLTELLVYMYIAFPEYLAVGRVACDVVERFRLVFQRWSVQISTGKHSYPNRDFSLISVVRPGKCRASG